jgi:tetratricopeptide (TPR) repeat protein
MSMNCPKCGHECAPQFNFCPRCGALLLAAVPAMPQAATLSVPEEKMPGPVGAVAFASPLVGRQGELNALFNCVDDVAGGRGGVVNLIGEGGIGKSRLVAELRRVKQPHPHQIQAGPDEAAGGATPFWLEGGPLSLDEALPYWSWQGLLKNWLKSDEAESEAETQRKLRHEVEQLLDTPPSQENAHDGAGVDQVYPYLATLLSLQLEDAFAERVVYLNAEGLKMQTFQAVRLWLEHLTQTRPLVLVFEDLHRADATSLALLLDCMPLVVELPLLFINVFRPERECDCWQLRDAGEMTLAPLGRYTEIVLNRLSPQESDELIHNLLQRETPPTGLRAKVRSRAEGNPFFTEEIVRALIESNTLVRDSRHQAWTIAGSIDELRMPDTLQEVINTRIERLPAQTRQVLQRAAVVGRVFWGGVVAQLDADQDIEPHLDHLQQTGLIQRRDDVPVLGAEYTFSHALTHQAAYDSIPEARRREYHRQVAAFIEDSFAERLEEYYGLLAHHAQQAEDRERACRYAQEAAERAAGRYANQEAIRFYEQALELFRATDVKSRTQRFDLLQKLQAIYARDGQTQACERALREMLRLASLLADADRLIEVYVTQAALYLGTNLRQAEESARLGLRLARVMEHHNGEARALLQRAWVNRRLWRKRQAIAQGEAALRASRRAGDRRIEGRVLCDLADFYAFNYDYETALGYSAQALEISQALGDRSTAAKAHLIASRNLSALGRHAEAITKTKETITLARQISDRQREASGLNVLGNTYANAGQYDPALDAYRESLEIYHQIGDRLFESWVYGNIGWMYVAQGHFESALDYFRNSHDASRRVDDRSVEARALMAMASLRRKLGQYDEAERLANTARDIVPRAGWREIERWALGELSLAAWWRGDLGGALGLAQTALGHAYHQQDLQAIGWDMALLASVHLGQPWFGSASAVGNLHLALHLADRAEEIGRQTRDRFIQIWGSEALGLVHWRLGQHDEALKWSQRTIELLERTPGYSDSREPLYFEHSLVLRACGHDDQAEAALQRARAELLRKADLMTDPDMRHTYLEQVPVSRAIQSAS